MTMILINLFYLAVLALVIAAGVYLYRTRESAGDAAEPAQAAEENEGVAGAGSTKGKP